MADHRKRLGLGTVQFGLDYGVSNARGVTPAQDISEILAECGRQGICVLDTASTYGHSEKALGDAISPDASFKIVTKTIPLKGEAVGPFGLETVRAGIENSFARLRKDHIHGLLLHHADDLLLRGGEKLYGLLQSYKEAGKVSKIGISIYEQEQIEKVLSRYDIDLIQIPMNVFDQRLSRNGILHDLKNRGVEIHARSAFLQGIVFIEPDALPAHLDGLKTPLRAFLRICHEKGWSPSGAALGHLMARTEIDYVICGVNTPAHFRELCKAAENLPFITKDCFDICAVDDAHLVNPALWTQAATAKI